MKFTAKHAQAIAAAMGNMTLTTITEMGCLEAYAALVAYSKGFESGVYIDVPVECYIEGIKAVRCITGWGLKESKDWIEARDPQRRGGLFGPLVTIQDATTLASDEWQCRLQCVPHRITVKVIEPSC